jgi:hypothetical protein
VRSYISFGHREYRVPGILSSRPNWVPPTPSPTRECCSSPSLELRRETHSLAGWGGGPSFGEGTDTLVLYVYYSICNPSTVLVLGRSGKKKTLGYCGFKNHNIYYDLGG